VIPLSIGSHRASATCQRTITFLTLLSDGADRDGIRVSDDEHCWSMGTHPAAGNARGAVARGETTAPAPKCGRHTSCVRPVMQIAEKEPSRRSDAGDYELRDGSVNAYSVSDSQR
jgi:hypothetical protein